MNKTFSKGKANQDSLADRMKRYESVTTGVNLMERLPIYARIDMRAGHSFCRSLKDPFDKSYAEAMNFATTYIVEKTGALVGYTQSDEASFVWLDSTKIPFETRLFKLQSVLASMFTSAFIMKGLDNELAEIIKSKYLPAFDCRVMNMPSLEECANMILWREKDSIKNSITLLALENFSDKEIHKKNGDEKIQMLKELKGIDYFEFLTEQQRCGSYFRRELYQKVLTEDEICKIPEKNRPLPNDNGEISVTRSHIVNFSFGFPLIEISNKVNALFFKEAPVKKVTKTEQL